MKTNGLSVIIPVLNEANLIGQAVEQFVNHPRNRNLEVIVVDSSANNATQKAAEAAGAHVVKCAQGRAIQMNKGAAIAKNDCLYFVHADVQVPENFDIAIEQAMSEGYKVGCFQSQFNRNSKLAQFIMSFSKYDLLFCRGGDQTMFIQKQLFNKLSGFDESFTIMEDFDFARRVMKEKIKFHVIEQSVSISSRKFKNNSFLKVQLANMVAMTMFYLRFSPNKIKRSYGKLLDYKHESYKVE